MRVSSIRVIADNAFAYAGYAINYGNVEIPNISGSLAHIRGRFCVASKQRGRIHRSIDRPCRKVRLERVYKHGGTEKRIEEKERERMEAERRESVAGAARARNATSRNTSPPTPPAPFRINYSGHRRRLKSADAKKLLLISQLQLQEIHTYSFSRARSPLHAF